MIDLNTPIQAEERKPMNYDPLPEGEYVVELTEFDDWEIKDGKDKKTGQKLQYAVSAIKVTVLTGEYEGRILWDWLTHHPNMPWNTPNFLDAFGGENLPLSRFKELVGNAAVAHVTIDKNATKKVTDPDTGEESEEVSPRNNVKYYSKYEGLADLEFSLEPKEEVGDDPLEFI